MNFAPPRVNLERHLTSGSTQVCTPQASNTAIADPSVENARGLIHNFVLVYRCRAHEAANGRQFFQIPSFFATVGATAASAFGAGPDVAIAGGVANSIFNAGNAYYAPQRQAEIFDSALDALLCIQTEAVGIDAFDIGRLEDARGDDEGGGGDEAVHVSPAQQYYDVIRAALFSVERVKAQRLSVIGTFDPAGVVAEITTLNEDIAQRRQRAGEDVAASDGEAGGGAGDADLRSVRIELRTLQPKLQRCVVRAKI